MPESTDVGLQAYNTLTMKEIYESSMTASPMPQYQSHKKVSALKIKKVMRDPVGHRLSLRGSRIYGEAIHQ